MPKKKKTKTRNIKKGEQYVVEQDSISRKKISCPKCGPGVFMAEHKDRFHCGKCGYTKMKNSKPPGEEREFRRRKEREFRRNR